MHDNYPSPPSMRKGKAPIVESKKPVPVDADMTSGSFTNLNVKDADRWPSAHPAVDRASSAYGQPKPGASSSIKETSKASIPTGPKG
jgi:hypothetical protein